MHELGVSMIRVLSVVNDGRDRLRDIAAAAGLSVPRTSVILSGLRDRGFLEKHRRGMSETVGFTGLRFAHLFRAMLERGFPARECLADTRMTTLAVIAANGGAVKASDLAAYTGYSAGTVRALLHAAGRNGVLKRTGSGYALSSSMSTLGAFLQSYGEHIAGTAAGCISKNALVHRIFGFEFVFSLPPGEKPTGAVPTAATAISRDGVETRGQRDYYHYSTVKRKLGMEDFMYDLILLERDSVQNLMIALIYLKKRRIKVDAGRLEMIARVLGSRAKGEDMLRYVDGEDRHIEGFPDYAEFQGKYRVYGEAP